MTVKDLIFQLQALPEDWQDLEVMLSLTMAPPKSDDTHMLEHTAIYSRQPCTTVKVVDSAFKPKRYVELTRG